MSKPATLRYFTAFNNLSTKEEQQKAVFKLAKEFNSQRGNIYAPAHQIDFDEAHEDIVNRLDIANAQWSYTNRLALFYDCNFHKSESIVRAPINLSEL